MPKQVLGLLAFLGLTFVAAALGSLFTNKSVDSSWYRSLDKPSFQPPNSAFGPVWTTLYALMAISAWLVWRAPRGDSAAGEASKWALTAWSLQLVLNVAWSATFFGARSIGGGVVIAGLLAAIAATLGLSAQVSKPAAALLLPYLAWTAFATVLNVRIWQLNEG